MTTPRGRLSHGREWVTTWHAVPINSFQLVYHARCSARRRHTCWCVSVCLYTPYLTPIVEFWRFFTSFETDLPSFAFQILNFHFKTHIKTSIPLNVRDCRMSGCSLYRPKGKIESPGWIFIICMDAVRSLTYTYRYVEVNRPVKSLLSALLNGKPIIIYLF